MPSPSMWKVTVLVSSSTLAVTFAFSASGSPASDTPSKSSGLHALSANPAVAAMRSALLNMLCFIIA